MKKPLPAVLWEPFRGAASALLASGLLALAAPGCGPSAPEGPPEGSSNPRIGLSADAKLETEAMLRENLAAPRDPSDGGGRAWRVVGAEEGPHVAGSRERIEIVFETIPVSRSRSEENLEVCQHNLDAWKFPNILMKSIFYVQPNIIFHCVLVAFNTNLLHTI